MFSGSMVALVTPMAADLSLDLDALGGLIQWHIASGTRALVIAGTTGESASLTAGEYRELLEAAVAFSGGRIPVIAGAGSASTAGSLQLAQTAKDCGVQGLLVVTPYYYRPTQEGLYRHYLSIADAVDLPLVLYNVPTRTGIDLLPDTVARLSQHERIVGVKEAVPDANRIEALLSKAQGLKVFSGDDGSARRSLGLGAHGVISVVANIVPQLIARLCELCAAGEDIEADRLDQQLASVYRAMFLEPNPIPVKWTLEQMGRIVGSIRLPLTPLTESAAVEITKELAPILDLRVKE